MKHTKRIFALLLAGVLLTTAVGCDVGGGGSVTVPSTAATTTDSGPTICPPSGPSINRCPNFETIVSDPDDLILRVAYVEGTNGEYTLRSLEADELSDASVDIKTQERDKGLKEKLGLELRVECVSDSVAGMTAALGASLVAGESDYDILAGYGYFDIALASQGVLLDLAKLDKYDADYIDLSAPYWAEEYNKAMSYQGAHYWITGDLALRYIGGVYCTFVNTQIYNTYLESANGSIYTLVKENKWTLDSLVTMEKQYESLRSKYNEELPYFFGYEANDSMDGLVFGAGVPFTKRDAETGEISVVLGKKDTNFGEFGEKLTALLTGSELSHKYPEQSNEQVRGAFMDGEVLFMVDQMLFAYTYSDWDEFTKMEYAILPMPKLNADQRNYQTTVHDGCTIFGITHCSSRIPQAAAALEYLAAYSSSLVAPEFYETALRGKYSRDPNAAEMIDLIHDGITTDFAVAWGKSVGDPIYLLRTYTGGVDKTIERKREDWQQKLDGVTELLGIYSQN